MQRGSVGGRLKRYEVVFHLNVIDFHCITRATSKKKAVADVLFNINLRDLKKICGIRVIQIKEDWELSRIGEHSA